MAIQNIFLNISKYKTFQDINQSSYSLHHSKEHLQFPLTLIFLEFVLNYCNLFPLSLFIKMSSYY